MERRDLLHVTVTGHESRKNTVIVSQEYIIMKIQEREEEREEKLYERLKC